MRYIARFSRILAVLSAQTRQRKRCAAEGAEAAAKAAAAAGLVEVPGADASGAGAPGHRLADHLRKGKVGDWRAHFGPFPDVLQRFEVAVGDAMRGTGLRYELGGGSFLAF